MILLGSCRDEAECRVGDVADHVAFGILETASVCAGRAGSGIPPDLRVELEQALATITGFAVVSLQPNLARAG